MKAESLVMDSQNCLKLLPDSFNKRRLKLSYFTVNNYLNEIQTLAKKQCLGNFSWPEIDKVNAWMISSETATFMKAGGLGMIASELPEAFNNTFAQKGEKISVVTPLYLGDTKKKKAVLVKNVYTGSERNSVEVRKAAVIKVPFIKQGSEKLEDITVEVYLGKFANTDYIFLANNHFFSINPHKDNPSAQDGCYVYNEFGVNEVERFAFFSKAVYVLIKNLYEGKVKGIDLPNALIANDWHSGALSGLTKYFTRAQAEVGLMDEDLAEELYSLPIIHIAHHMGYQGWDYENTTRILNSLYEYTALMVFKNAKSIKNNNQRAKNTLIVHDCYNQASCNFHLADRVVTVSRNYLEEVSKETDFGYDFRDILKIRKDHRNFVGIINGYDKKLISPNKEKIAAINQYFSGFNFRFYDENNLEAKLHNKKEFIRLISKIASDKDYKQKTIPLIETYKFSSIVDDIKNPEKTPVLCMTSRLVEQKGYDIAALAIENLVKKIREQDSNLEYPIFILGGAGNPECFEILTNLKDRVSVSDPKIGERIFVFRGYRDEFAYAIQLASDFYLMPSHFEPCGLTQMEAMAKGALPIATSTGGLVDTIEDGVDGFRTAAFFAGNQTVYGTMSLAKRLKNNEIAYTQTLERALNIFYFDPEKLHIMTRAAMLKDFSWDVSGGSVFRYYSLLKHGHI